MTATSLDPAASTGSQGVVYTGFGGGVAATPTGTGKSTGKPNSENSALSVTKYGTVVLIGGLSAGFLLL